MISEIVIATGNSTKTTEPSPVFPIAIKTATGESIRPIVIITGPTTTAGRSLCKKSLPFTRIKRLRTT